MAKKINVNCEGKPCSCGSANKARFETLDGSKYIVVPVVMAIDDVVMNGALLPAEEFFAPSWNGVPVTVGHPDDGAGNFLSANSPPVVEKWVVGHIYNATVKDGKLMGEAWVKTDKANKVKPGILKSLEGEKPMDVSTGFFSDFEEVAGSLNGREYSVVHRNVKPDHLALLPDEVGACSWSDGCGVRPNAKGNTLKKVMAIFKSAIRKNADEGDERKGMIDNLIASESTPFSDDDRPGLEGLSEKTIKAMYESLDDGASDPKDPPAEASEDNPEEDEEMNKAEVEEIVKNAVTAAVTAAVADLKVNLSAEDQAALARARKVSEDHRNGLIGKIVANSKLTKEFLEKQTTEQLEALADGIVAPAPVANFGGRALPNDGGVDDPDAKDMAPVGVFSAFAKTKKE